MQRYGGAGILPSRAYHQELPTTVPVRDVECYDVVFGTDAGPERPTGRLASPAGHPGHPR
jgi:hypothetical protein